MDVRAQVFALEFPGQGWDSLQFFKCSILRIILITNQSRIQFIDEIGKLSVGMKCQMARTCARLNIHFSVFVQFPVFQIHLIDKEFIQTQIHRDSKTIGWVRKDAVSMGTRLAFRMNA